MTMNSHLTSRRRHWQCTVQCSKRNISTLQKSLVDSSTRSRHAGRYNHGSDVLHASSDWSEICVPQNLLAAAIKYHTGLTGAVFSGHIHGSRLLSWLRTKRFFICSAYGSSETQQRSYDVSLLCTCVTHQVLRCRSCRRYYHGMKKEPAPRHLRSSWILVINGLKFPS